VRIAMANLALQPVYEGLGGAQMVGRATDRTGCEAGAGPLEFVADYQFAMRGKWLCATTAP